MKTPYYSGDYTAVQHNDLQEDDQLRERMLESRLANRDDVRDIYVVTTLPWEPLKDSKVGRDVVKGLSKPSKTDLSWAMHWAIQVGDQYFELQRGYPDPLRTGLRMSTWDQQKRKQIHQRYRQGVTAMTDDEIKAVGERYFSRLERIDINTYDLWCNNCHIAVDRMLRDIGGLHYYRRKLESLQDMVKHLLNQAIMGILETYAKFRGWNEEIITRYSDVIYKTVKVITSRNVYPKRHWIRSDIEKAEGALKKLSAVKDHWFLSVLESSLALRHSSEDTYVRRGVDGKPELNFNAVKEATKGIFDEDEKNSRLNWLKAVPWLAAGFIIGTPRWAAAVIFIAVSRASQVYDERLARSGGLKGGLEESLAGLGVSPKPPSAISPRRQDQRRSTGQRRVKSKTLSTDNKLVPRYERCYTTKGVPYFIDHLSKSRSWDAPDQQEMCSRIIDPPLSKKWEEKQEDGRKLYLNRNTGEIIPTRPGPAEIWVIKKKLKPDWVKSIAMALPSGWEMQRTEEGEMYYLDHNVEPPTSTTFHPMRREIEDERQSLLPEWNVEWDSERGKKYRNIQTDEIRWKAVDGPRHVLAGEKAKISSKTQYEVFVEPLPPGWITIVAENGQKVYKNGKTGKGRIERTTHPLTDKRRRLQSEWEMRYTPGKRSYWVHFGHDGRGSTWWKRNRIIKNTSLKNNASGWKRAQNGHGWEWFEGGDVPHSEIPVLDLDDPADIEFREYPLVLPKRTTTESGAFIEPLPSNWVMRTREDGSVCYWDFKEEARSELHPNEEERRNLPALWEMRFTRHGRQYFIDHEDGSTWWTHPWEDKHEQQKRAGPGQSQNGWKLREDGQTWERFEENPSIETAEQSLGSLTHTASFESETSQEGQSPEMWRSLSFTREFLKNVGSSDVITNARSRIPQTPKLLKRLSERSPSTKSLSTQSPQEGDQNEWLTDTPAMTEEPQSCETPELEHTHESLAPIEDLVDECKKLEPSPSVSSSLYNTPLEALKEDGENTEEKPVEKNEPSQRNKTIDDEMIDENMPIEEVLAEPATEEVSTSEEIDTSSPSQKGAKKRWAKRTASGLLALKKNIEKRASERGFVLPNERVKNPEPAVTGLGISIAEPPDSRETVGLPSTEEQADGETK